LGVVIEEDQLLLNLQSGKKVRPQVAFSQTHYNRKNGKEKVISRIPYNGLKGEEQYLAENFDIAFAIDTNTKQIQNEKISASSIFRCTFSKVEQEIEVQAIPDGALFFKNMDTIHPEKFAWSQLCKLIHNNPAYQVWKRIALITDHDLGNHIKYNSRELPIFQGMMLPEKISIMYATSDTKGKSLNRLIKECDKESSRLLRELEQNGYISNQGQTMKIVDIPEITLG
jgi:hypothetical protein